MGKPIDTISEEAMDKFFDFLSKKNLAPQEAFSIVYYLQEEMEILPDHYELCSKCGILYDSHCGGGYVDEDFMTDWTEEPLKPLPEYMDRNFCEWCIVEIEGE